MVIKQAVEVLKTEAEGILNLIDQLDDNFEKMIDLIYNSKGRVIISGIGKSGLVGRKIVATLNSTGTNSFFLHPVEAMHGDLGMVNSNDIFLAMSNSGETDELNILIPSIKKIGCPIIAFTGRPKSNLALHSSLVINVGVKKEACPLGLAPTTSTTALLAIGDALAVVLINKNKFKPNDFKKFHPGGALGQRLASNVQEIMLTGKSVPILYDNTNIKQAINEINKLTLGAVFIIDSQEKLIGIITDGDIRRFISIHENIINYNVKDVMTPNPRSLYVDTPVYDAINIMEQYQITVLPILDKDHKIKGLLHLHDILGKGEFKFNGY